MIGIIIAIISGALMSVQGVFNTQVTKASSVWVSNVWVHLSALLVCLLAWVIVDRTSLITLLDVKPRYLLLAGVIGTGITWTVIKSIEQLGPAQAVLFIVVAQTLVSYGIQVLGLFGVEKEPLELRKVIGLGIAMVGVYVFQR